MKPHRCEKFLYSSFAWRILISQQFSMHLYLLPALSRLILLFVINWNSSASLPCFSAPQGLFQPARFISILLFCSTGIISADKIHLYLAFLFHRDYFSRQDSSLSRFSVPQGLFRPDQMHLYLAFLFHRDYFNRPDSSLSCHFVPQGLFRPARCIPAFLFYSAGIISPRLDTSPIAETISTRPFHQLPI